MNRTRTGRSSRQQGDHVFRLQAVEILESRMLLSTGPSARIVNGSLAAGYPSGIVNGSPTSGFAAVGQVGDRTGLFCTGTLIAPQHVLTAAHCAEGVRDTDGRFRIGGTTYATSTVYVHPDYRSSRIGSESANDIAIYELNVAIASINPDPIYRGDPRVGDVLTLVGFGAGGSGSTGHDGSYGVKRAGTTPIDGVTERRILWTFDNNSESNTAPGDSGGPAYLDVGGTYYVAGVTSGGDRADAGIGDHSFDSRVDYYADWIDSIIGTVIVQPGDGSGSSGDDHADSVGTSATALAAAGGSMQGSGRLEVAGDRDLFRLQLANRGNLTVDLTAAGGSLDTLLRLYDAAGNLVAYDDDSGEGTNSRLSVHLDAGTYYVSAGSYNDAGTGSYSIRASHGQDDHANTLSGATPVSLTSAGYGSATGTVEQASDRDVFRFVANRSGQLALDLRATQAGFDPVMTVYDAKGRVIASNDDSGGTTNSHVTLRVRAGSTYYVQAAGYGTTHGTYSLDLAPSASSRSKGMRAAAVSEVATYERVSAVSVSTPDSTTAPELMGEVLVAGHSAPAILLAGGSFLPGTYPAPEQEDSHESILADALCPSLASLESDLR